MNKKVTAIVLASALASPVALAKISVAAGGGRGPRAAAALASTSIKLEAEKKDRTLGAEGEAEYGERTRNGITQKKLSAEVEVILDNAAAAALVASDAKVEINGTTCKFTKAPSVEPLLTDPTKSEVEFHGSVSQSGTDPIVMKGLDCGATIPTVAAGQTAIFTVNTTPAISLTATFVND